MQRINPLYLHCILAFLLGAIGVLAFSPFDLWIMAIFALSGLFYVSTSNTFSKTTLLSFCWGMGLFLCGVSWVYVSIQQFGGASVILAFFLVLLLTAYLSLYPLLFNFILNRFWPQSSFIKMVIAAPSLWMLVEWLRGWLFNGFPWLQFGYSQINGPLKNIAPILGVNMITLIIAIICGLITYSLQQRNIKYALIALFMLTTPLTLKPFQWVNSDPLRQITITLIQGNTDQAIKWSPTQLDKIINNYITLTRPYLGKSDVIIWPEAAIPSTEIRQQEILTTLDTLARENHTLLGLGLLDYVYETDKFHNEFIVLGGQTPYHYPATNRYYKYELVPFGEMTPLEPLFAPIAKLLAIPMSNISPGNYLQPPLLMADYKWLTAICYEIIEGKQMRDNFTRETSFILNISNDTWFGKSIGPWQHFQMARMRAVELGRILVRGTNNGITAIVDQQGLVIAQLPQFKQGVLNTTISPVTGITPYAKFGDYPYWIVLFSLFTFSLFHRHNQKA